MIKNQVYAGIGLALLGLMLFVILSPVLYYESPIGIHLEGSSQGSLRLDPNQTMSVSVNATSPYLVVGYNYTVGPVEVELKNQSASIQPFHVGQQGHGVYLDYWFSKTAGANLTLTFHNNATQTQTIQYLVVGLRFGNLPLYTVISYVELAMFVAGIAVALVGAFRKPKTI